VLKVKRESEQTSSRIIKHTNIIEILFRINLFCYKDSCMSVLVREAHQFESSIIGEYRCWFIIYITC